MLYQVELDKTPHPHPDPTFRAFHYVGCIEQQLCSISDKNLDNANFDTVKSPRETPV